MSSSSSAGLPAHHAHLSTGPLLALVFNACVWGTSWWPLRRLHEAGLHPLWATASFFVLGTALMLCWRPRVAGMLLRSPSLWVLAAASGLTNASFNWAVSTGDVMRVVLLFYLMPLWAVLLARVVLGERFTASGLLRVLLGLVGAALVLWPVEGAGGWQRLGSLPDMLGVLGGLGFAFTNVWLRREAGQLPQARALAMFVGGWTLPCVLGTVLGLQGVLAWPPAPAWGWMLGALGLGLVFVAGNLGLQYAAARLPVSVASVVMLTEVVFAAVSAVWWGGEVLRPPVLLGGALIMGSAALAAWQSWASS
jgi:drug/metabolite transporter (DMT)-like permease